VSFVGKFGHCRLTIHTAVAELLAGSFSFWGLSFRSGFAKTFRGGIDAVLLMCLFFLLGCYAYGLTQSSRQIRGV